MVSITNGCNFVILMFIILPLSIQMTNQGSSAVGQNIKCGLGALSFPFPRELGRVVMLFNFISLGIRCYLIQM